jgi:hypothetical protein
MKKQDLMSAYHESERNQKAVAAIDRIIEQREGKGFSLPAGFDPYLSPEAEAVAATRCEAQLRELCERGFLVLLDEGVPLKAAALYLEHVARVTEALFMPSGESIVFNGCGGWCEGCFQSPWCRIKEEIDREESEELAAGNG